MNKFRFRCFQKLAQQISPQPVSGSPQPVDLKSLKPDLLVGYPHSSTQISSLCNDINTAIFYESNGKQDFTKMYRARFETDTSSAANLNLKKLLDLSKQVYQYIFKNNLPFTRAFTAKEASDSIAFLENSSILNSIPTTNSGSQLATKLGDVKAKIKQRLAEIKTSVGTPA